MSLLYWSPPIHTWNLVHLTDSLKCIWNLTTNHHLHEFHQVSKTSPSPWTTAMVSCQWGSALTLKHSGQTEWFCFSEVLFFFCLTVSDGSHLRMMSIWQAFSHQICTKTWNYAKVWSHTTGQGCLGLLVSWLLYKVSKFRTVGFPCLLSMIWVPSRVEDFGIFSRLEQVQDLKCWEDPKKQICPL